MPAGLAGTYFPNEFPVTARVEAQGKLLYFRIAETLYRESCLTPESDTEFHSLDGAIKIRFQVEEGVADGIGVNAFGYDLTGKKE